MARFFLIGIAWVVLTGTCIAADAITQINNYAPGNLHELADRIASQTSISIKQEYTPEGVLQILGKAQLDYLRILIRQNDYIIRQNEEMIRQIRNIPR